MNCDKCHKACTQATHGPGVPEDQYWCDDCCRTHNVKVPSTFVLDGDRLRAERNAEAERKHQEEIDRLREQKGLDRFYSKEVAS